MPQPEAGRDFGAAAADGGRRPALATLTRRPLPDVPRHDDRQRRPGRRPVEPARRRLAAAVGRERLRPDLRRPHAGAWARWATAWDASASCWAVSPCSSAARCSAPWRPACPLLVAARVDHGRGRRGQRARHAVDHPPPLPRAGAARPGAGRVGRRGRSRPGHGAGDRRRAGGLGGWRTVFWFNLVAGLLVLLAALADGARERRPAGGTASTSPASSWGRSPWAPRSSPSSTARPPATARRPSSRSSW